MTNTETRESETPKRLGFKSAGLVRRTRPVREEATFEARIEAVRRALSEREG